MAEPNSTELKTKYTEEPRETLSRKTLQLASMLIMITGEGFKTFDMYNDEIKENYLWACSDYADEINKLANSIV